MTKMRQARLWATKAQQLREAAEPQRQVMAEGAHASLSPTKLQSCVGSEDVGATSCCIRLAPCCIHAAGRFLRHRFMRDLARHVVCKSGQRRR